MSERIIDICFSWSTNVKEENYVISLPVNYLLVY